jgi:hypothetical protein
MDDLDALNKLIEDLDTAVKRASVAVFPQMANLRQEALDADTLDALNTVVDRYSQAVRQGRQGKGTDTKWRQQVTLTRTVIRDRWLELLPDWRKGAGMQGLLTEDNQ